MSSVGKAKKGKKMSRIEIIPENAEYEEHQYEDMEEQLRSIGDETPSDDTGEQEEISTRQEKNSTRKRKRSNKSVIPDASSKGSLRSNLSRLMLLSIHMLKRNERRGLNRGNIWYNTLKMVRNGQGVHFVSCR